MCKIFLYHKHLRFLIAMFSNCTCTHKTQQGTVGVLLAGNEIYDKGFKNVLKTTALNLSFMNKVYEYY